MDIFLKFTEKWAVTVVLTTKDVNEMKRFLNGVLLFRNQTFKKPALPHLADISHTGSDLFLQKHGGRKRPDIRSKFNFVLNAQLPIKTQFQRY